MNEIIKINLTTFRGQCSDATHYYASVSYWCEGEFHKDKITRPITQAEIDADKDRFYSYDAGEPTECFSSWKQAIETAKEYINNNMLKGDVCVEGIPNKRALSLEQALSPDLDTRKKCCKCGKVFGDREGFYNYPSGAVCVKCYDRKTIKRK